MFNVGAPEMMVIFLLALLLLGPEKLPKAARTMGKVMGELRRYSDGFREEIKSVMDDVIETDARTEGAKLSTAEQAEPDVHEVKATAEPELHAAVEDNPAPATGAPEKPALRAVQDRLPETPPAVTGEAPDADAATG